MAQNSTGAVAVVGTKKLVLQSAKSIDHNDNHGHNKKTAVRKCILSICLPPPVPVGGGLAMCRVLMHCKTVNFCILPQIFYKMLNFSLE